MVAVAVDPGSVVNEVAARSHQAPGDDPPRLLRNPPGVGAPLPSVHQGPELAAVHQNWAGAHAVAAGRGGIEAARARVQSKLSTVAAAAVLPAQQADRALIGDLIRAVDALARRVDEIGNRVLALEALVEEVVVVTGEDLARIRAAVAAPAASPRSPAAGPAAHRPAASDIPGAEPPGAGGGADGG